jgi:hypothetical protein
MVSLSLAIESSLDQRIDKTQFLRRYYAFSAFCKGWWLVSDTKFPTQRRQVAKNAKEMPFFPTLRPLHLRAFALEAFWVLRAEKVIFYA